MITKEILSKVIKSAAMEWVYDKDSFISYWDVNSGSCGEFAAYVLERLPENHGVKMVSTGFFLEEKGLESYGDNGEHSNHVWLILNDEHFDIERPLGVSNFMELPYFQREIKEKDSNFKNRDLYFFLLEHEKSNPHLVCDLKSYL